MGYDYMLDPPEWPSNWCEEHEVELTPDADEDGRCDYCHMCEAELHPVEWCVVMEHNGDELAVDLKAGHPKQIENMGAELRRLAREKLGREPGVLVLVSAHCALADHEWRDDNRPRVEP